jgi:protease-4
MLLDAAAASCDCYRTGITLFWRPFMAMRQTIRVWLMACVLACLPAGAWADNAAVAEAPAAPGAIAPAATVVGWLELTGSLRESPLPFAWVTEAEAGPSLTSVLRQLHHVAHSKTHKGVVVHLDYPDLDMTQIEAIANALDGVRAAGKKTLVFSEAYDLRTYLLACSADMILLQRRGDVMLSGIGIEEMYLAGLLDKVGVKADFVQVGRFKGAADPLTLDKPSEAWSQNIDALLDDIYGSILERIATGRNLTREQVEAIIQDCWTMNDDELIRRRVVDRVCDRDLIDVTEVEFGDTFTWDEDMGAAPKQAANTNAFAFFQTLFQATSSKPKRDSIAVVHARGPITSGDSSYGDGLFSGDAIGSRTICEVLSDAGDDHRIKAVVIRIDSPGGSAIASEVIWQSVRQLAEKKPVYASIGGTAASGGYYIACAADEIYVAPDSIVGSIGVVGGKLIAGGLYEKIGIGIHRRSRGPHGDLFNSVDPFTDQQRQMLQLAFEKTYSQFTQRVADGRGRRLADVGAVAEGRLFTGRQAALNGMADKVGGLSDAVRDVAQRVGLQPGRYDVINLPPPMSLPEFLDTIFKTQAPAVAAPTLGIEHLARRTLGERRWRAARSIVSGLMQLQREPVLTLMPSAIVID